MDGKKTASASGSARKALRAKLTKTVDELKNDREESRAKAAKDHGASIATLNTLANMAKNKLHLLEMCEEWSMGKPGIRKSKIAFDRLTASQKRPWTEVMLRCWRKRPPNMDGGMKKACLLRYQELLDEGDKVNASSTTLTEIDKVAEAVELLNKWEAESLTDSLFPGRGGLRTIQNAEEKVLAIETRLGGPMDKAKKYAKWPCLKSHWPDEDATLKSECKFELPLNASPSLAQAELDDKQGSDGEEMAQGGYEGEQAMIFDTMFGDKDAEESEGAEDTEHAEEVSRGSPVSPCLGLATGYPSDEEGADYVELDSTGIDYRASHSGWPLEEYRGTVAEAQEANERYDEESETVQFEALNRIENTGASRFGDPEFHSDY